MASREAINAPIILARCDIQPKAITLAAAPEDSSSDPFNRQSHTLTDTNTQRHQCELPACSVQLVESRQYQPSATHTEGVTKRYGTTVWINKASATPSPRNSARD